MVNSVGLGRQVFDVPGAQDTTVLIVGATNRIVVRKLMLRGYNVTRNDQHMLPISVDIMFGVLAMYCWRFVFSSSSRVAVLRPTWLKRVDNQGVRNVAKAFPLAQSRAGTSSKSKLLIAKFKSTKSLLGWEAKQGSYFQNIYILLFQTMHPSRFDEGTDASFEFSENGQAVFSGFVLREVDMLKYDGLLLSVGGNGRPYVLSSRLVHLLTHHFARKNTK
uniref:Uncharacterized protein n=1 Tax=Leersia perrieri TaxID=77586 RepID=A0A0D9VC12_9ORYZ